jgi:hypothetical protein
MELQVAVCDLLTLWQNLHLLVELLSTEKVSTHFNQINAAKSTRLGPGARAATRTAPEELIEN